MFISYAHTDSAFVDKVRQRLMKEGASVWLDRHDAVAGPLKRQVTDAIRVNNVVLLVLSKASVDSDWVAYELKKAREKEKKEGRDVLCPVALDATWKARIDDPAWLYLTDKLILDFPVWENDEAFDPQFQKLLKGLKIYYPPADAGSSKADS